ncbi:hypothetical protein MMC13_002751 [Lambiella insularis]|nr:hypothetical protein [Lambiella insularis]
MSFLLRIQHEVSCSLSFALFSFFFFGELDVLFVQAAPVDSCPTYSGSSTSSTSNAVHPTGNGTAQPQGFWAGADIGTVQRAEAIPGRVFYDFDGTTVKDPIKTLGDAGVNAFRVETEPGQCLGPTTTFDNSGNLLGRELLFELDGGCIDIQVKTAQQAVAAGTRFVLTINQGLTIPTAWESYTYAQMLSAVQNETQRQLQPFLDANLLPDIILFENEGTDGFLMTENSTGHTRGVNDGKSSAATLDQELCGHAPTGNMASYPQLAGFYKGEIAACNAAIAAARLSPASGRYGLHSHGQYVQWKEILVHGPSPASQTTLTTPSGTACDFSTVIPAAVLAQNASALLTVMGFSAYPDPMTPADIDSAASIAATLGRLNDTLAQLQSYADAYAAVPGQAPLRSLGVEYATGYTAAQIPQQQAHTRAMWALVKGYASLLGVMWWEPWYSYNDWEGGNGALCGRTGGGNVTGEMPTETLTTWGEAAVS